MIYDDWLIITGIGLIMFALGLVDTLRDLKNADWRDLLFFAAGSVLLIIGALNAATLDFILPNGTLYTYQSEAVFIIPLFGLGFVSIGLAMMVIVLSVLNRNSLNLEF